MTITRQEVILLNVLLPGVGLLDEMRERFHFSTMIAETLGSEVLVSDDGSLEEEGHPIIVLGLPRDRITLRLSPTYTFIEQEYPEERLEQLEQVIDLAIQSTRLSDPVQISLTANLQMVYSSSSEPMGQRYIAERLSAGWNLDNSDWSLIGGALRLVCEHDGAIWNLNLEPRVNVLTSRLVYLGAHVQKMDRIFLDSSEILQALRKIWKQAEDFAVRLDQAA